MGKQIFPFSKTRSTHQNGNLFFTKTSDSIKKEKKKKKKKKKKVNWRRFKPEFSSLEDRISTFSLTAQSYSHETEAFQYTEKL